MHKSLAACSLLLALPDASSGLHNGLGLTPPMGYSSWNDCASEVTEERIKNVTNALIATGLAAKGYVYVNVDEGWLEGRDEVSGMLIEDKVKFPSGMKALGDWIHAQQVENKGAVMKYGLYTSRGTCQCSTKKYQAVGSAGHVQQDAQWMADVGMDYLKEDSCCGSQNHTVAFSNYAEMRDALNKTGRPVYFSLCGWHTWYAPEGDSLGNSWRIAGDGTNWQALSNCINENVLLSQYARPGAWNDPDLLQGTGVGSNDKATNPKGCFVASEIPQANNWYQTELQSRAQFSMWAVMSAPLLISADVGQVSQFQLKTWGNEEVIAVNQNFRVGGPYQGNRLMGTDLIYDKASNTGSGVNVWGKLLPKGVFALVAVNNGNSTEDITCNTECMAPMVDALVESYQVRDLWKHQAVGPSVEAPVAFTFTQVGPHGGVQMVTMTPAAAT